MASSNRRITPITTHNGAPAKQITPEQQLRRSVLSCLLWENEFYEDGVSIANRIKDTIPKCHPDFVAALAITAREAMKLRHIPLWLVRHMAQLDTHKHLVKSVLSRVIQRPDELCEFISLYWKEKKQPLSKQVKLGLASAFTKFNAFQLQKYNRLDKDIKLRDVLFLCHARPKDEQQAKDWKQLIDNTLPIPDTWEVALSATGANKKKVWTRLLQENNLGGLALLRNLRNMTQAGVDEKLIRESILNMNTERILPYRFIAAAKYAPHLEDVLEEVMLECVKSLPKIPGKTVVLIDVSGSMDQSISSKSDLTRLDAGCGLAMLLREMCEEVAICTFSLALKRIAPRRGFALRDAIIKSQEHSATYLGTSIKAIYSKEDLILKSYRGTKLTFQGQGLSPDRLIVITDEQSDDPVSSPQGRGYMINVASAKNGVGYYDWIHCDGWSEAVVAWIQELELDEK